MTAFSTLPLKPALLASVDALGYTDMTPVQAQSLPPMLEGCDVIAQAQTGSGKTAAFGLSLLQALDVDTIRLQALVLCPTRELADQVSKAIRKLAANIPNVKLLTLCGGMPLGPQLASLTHDPHIVVGTPGRVQEHLKRQSLHGGGIKVLVLDEADRMLDMGFAEAIDDIISRIAKHHQTLLFSATYPDEIRAVSQRVQNDPVEVTVDAPADARPAIEQRFHEVEPAQKPDALAQLLAGERGGQALVFCNMRRDVDAVAQELDRRGYSALALHGDMEQRDRDEVLVRFANHSCAVLVATDVAARGLHIPHVSHVFNYDLPHEAEDYVHRIGRTARLGAEGDAISFACDLYAMSLPDIETYIGQSIPVAAMEPELLVMPKPHAIDAEFAANAAADSAAFGDVVPPRPGEKPRRSGERSGNGRGAARPPRERKPAVADGRAATTAGEQSTAVAAPPAVAAPTDGSPAVEGARKPRRRRGGRNRRREGAPTDGVEATGRQPAVAEGNRAPRGERRPSRERTAVESAGSGHSRPSRQVAVTAGMPAEHAHAKKPGLLRRLTRLLTGR